MVQAKKFHLVEYGLLAGVTLQAVRVEPRNRRGLAAAALFLIGTVDEVSQRFIPMRTFAFTGMLANYIAFARLRWAVDTPRGRPPPETRAGAPIALGDEISRLEV